MAPATRRVGIAIQGQDTLEVLNRIKQVEDLGIQAVWLTTGGAGRDALTVFAAAATQTRRVMMGTSIIPTWPRHPVAVAQQARVIADLAPDRFRLGVGPSHRASMERLVGADFRDTRGHLREYLHILKALLHEGEVSYEGRYYHANAQTGVKLNVPVLASALRRPAFVLCGEEAEGVITWLCPAPYLRDVAVPAIREGAQRAGREAPPLVAHAPICVHDNADEVYTAMKEQMGHYPASPFYNRMLADAGFPEVQELKAWNNAMIDVVTLSGNEDRVEGRMRELFEIGATELVLSPLLAGGDKETSLQRTLALVAKVAGSLP